MTHGIDPDENDIDIEIDLDEETELVFGEGVDLSDDDDYGKVKKPFEPATPDTPGAEAEAGMAEPETEMSMADRLIAMEAEKAAMKDQLLRTMAEMENIRKRSERKLAEERIYAVEKFARDLLNVSDRIIWPAH